MQEEKASGVSFMALKEEHEELDERFFRHQEALLALDVPQAIETLRVYEERLGHHMRGEEEVLLPVYRRAGPIMGGAEELFHGEHRKMLEFLARFYEKLEAMESDPTDLKKQILRLLDEQATYKNLVLHHEMREHNILFPTLDKITEEEERRTLLLKCQQK
jgi:hemerythrin-like domain-containing protein